MHSQEGLFLSYWRNYKDWMQESFHSTELFFFFSQVFYLKKKSWLKNPGCFFLLLFAGCFVFLLCFETVCLAKNCFKVVRLFQIFCLKETWQPKSEFFMECNLLKFIIEIILKDFHINWWGSKGTQWLNLTKHLPSEFVWIQSSRHLQGDGENVFVFS